MAKNPWKALDDAYDRMNDLRADMEQAGARMDACINVYGPESWEAQQAKSKYNELRTQYDRAYATYASLDERMDY